MTCAKNYSFGRLFIIYVGGEDVNSCEEETDEGF